MIVKIDKYELERLQWQLSKYKEKCADLEKQLDQERDKSNHLQFRVDNELEPRIKREHESYDRWVTEDPGCRACKCFESKLEDLIDFVGDTKVARQYYGQIIKYPVKEGKWLNEDFPEKEVTQRDVAICSACKNYAYHEEGYSILSKYCPHCGAKMNG